MPYDVADVPELEAGGPGGMVRFMRKAVNARAFGFNYFTFPPNTDGREHDHAEDEQEGLELLTFGRPVSGGYEPPPWG